MTARPAIVSLAMYVLPEIEWAPAALWRRIASGVRHEGLRELALPNEVDQVRDLAALLPGHSVVFGQTCGYPFTHALTGRLQLIGTPVYDAPGCRGPFYRSLVLVRAESALRTLGDLRGHVVAVNGWDSQSGWNALAALVAPLALRGHFFSGARVTGSHAQSLAAVRAGQADVAAIDCVTFALLHKHRRAAVTGLRVIAETEEAPALPFVTDADTPPEVVSALKRALLGALADPALAEAREELLLNWVEDLPPAAYDAISEMASRAIPAPASARPGG
ncbi:MAG: PhnD/SsuA/transferrin family substrate-binding protein [Rhodospirillaceae bacterium]|nr:PhnD/SsuA/transferrin family substrate-binding protein [Rhodospirillaceae bacterium]